MNRVIIVPSPEADFRPEKFIRQKVVEALARRDVPMRLIDPVYFTKLVDQSTFYDNGTMWDSLSRGIRDTIEIVKSGDVIFFIDGWNPMIPALKFYLHCANIKVKMCGIFHSSVETPGDLLGSAGAWARVLENNLVNNMLDKVFVATEYGYRMLPISGYRNNVVKVTGLPMITPHDTGHFRNPHPKRDWVVFPHRWAYDKQPEEFIKLRKASQAAGMDIEFIVTAPVDISEAPLYQEAVEAGVRFINTSDKQSYWDVLARSRWVYSSATLETFGYAIMDAIAMECIPIVPDRACYPYIYAPKFRYKTMEDALGILKTETNFDLEQCFQTGVLDAINTSAVTIATHITDLL